MELLSLGLTPIPGASPPGRDIRSTDLYEELTREIDKRSVVSGDGIVDWNRVVSLSEDILRNHSKDILVCSYLCIGLLTTKGLRGFASGVQVLHDLIINFWGGLYPPRLNGRINAILWWADNAIELLRKFNQEYWSSDDKSSLEVNFSELINFLQENGIVELEHVASLANSCKALISSQKSNTSLPTTQPSVINDQASQVESSATNANVNPVGKAANSVASINISGLADENLDSVLLVLSRFGSLIAKDQQLSYKYFKINRFVAWLDVDIIPPYDSELKTLLAPPDEYLQQSLRIFYQEKNWLELIKIAEPRVADYRFWLDLSFYVHSALDGLNQVASANEVAYATLSFVTRLNGIEKLLFSDGCRFASNETQDWLGNLTNTEADTSNFAAMSDSEELEQDLLIATEMVKQGQVVSAISLLHHKIKASLSLKSRFLRLLHFCQFSISVGYFQLLTGYINEILAIINDHQLEIWDPVLASNAYKLILKLSKQKKAIKLNEAMVNDIASRLSLLDPAAALTYYG